VKTFKDLVFKPHHAGDGLMAHMNFDNGYGVSVVRFKILGDRYGSYTDNDSEWELAVLKDDYLCYDSGITDDVIGHLKAKDVTKVMRKVQQLKAEESRS